MEKTFKVNGMHCHACETLIKEVLIEKGVKVVNASHKTGTVSVIFDESRLKEAQIKNAIKSEGYKIVE